MQHCIKREGKKVWEWIHHRQAHVYIAGYVGLLPCVTLGVCLPSCSNAKHMPVDVQNALKAVCMEWGNMSEESSEEYIATLLRSRRLQLETWN